MPDQRVMASLALGDSWNRSDFEGFSAVISGLPAMDL
jgi:hypothetical protein